MLLQAKQLGRERDVAVTTLAQMKSVGSHKEGLLQTTSEMRQSESDDLRRRLGLHVTPQKYFFLNLTKQNDNYDVCTIEYRYWKKSVKRWN